MKKVYIRGSALCSVEEGQVLEQSGKWDCNNRIEWRINKRKVHHLWREI